MLIFSFAEGAELRLLEHHHAEEFFALIDQNRSYLRQWLPEGDVYKSVDDCKRVIKSSLGQLAANAGFTLGIWWEGRLAGIIGAGKIDWENHSAMVGYLLGENYQGKGLATDACRALIDYLFSELKLHRIEIQCSPITFGVVLSPNGSASRKRACCARLKPLTTASSISRSTACWRKNGSARRNELRVDERQRCSQIPRGSSAVETMVRNG